MLGFCICFKKDFLRFSEFRPQIILLVSLGSPIWCNGAGEGSDEVSFEMPKILIFFLRREIRDGGGVGVGGKKHCFKSNWNFKV